MSDPSTLLREANALLNDLDHLPRPPARDQRRQDERYPCRLELNLQHPFGGETLQSWALTRDISSGGLACILRLPLPLDTPVWFDLPLPGGGAQKLSGLVMRREELEDGWHLIGVLLDQQIDPQKFLGR